MIRFVFRFIGLWILAAAFVFFVYDGTKSIAANAIHTTEFRDIWNNVHSTSLQQLQPLIERQGVAWLWDPVFLTVLAAPTWVVFGILGALMILLGRRKKPLIGYARS